MSFSLFIPHLENLEPIKKKKEMEVLNRTCSLLRTGVETPKLYVAMKPDEIETLMCISEVAACLCGMAVPECFRYPSKKSLETPCCVAVVTWAFSES